MNILSTLIFSDPSLGYNKADFEFPIDINKKYPLNGSGLCNQVFRFINSINFLEPTTNSIYFDLACKDINTGDMTKLSNIIDIESMSNKYSMNLFDITDFNFTHQFKIYNDHGVFRSYQNDENAFKDIAKKIIWNEKFENISKEIISRKNLNNTKVNLVHLRIDSDYKKHIMGNRTPSDDQSSEYWVNREKAYYQLIDRYRSTIKENCDKSIPLVLLMDETTHSFVKELSDDYDLVFFDKSEVLEVDESIEGRDIFALVDLLIGKNLDIEIFIGMENNIPLIDGTKHSSSFSIMLKYITDSKKIIMV